MKKRIAGFTAAVLACCAMTAFGGAVSAEDDVLTAPEDAFYQTYESECELHDYRSFTAAADFDVCVSPVDPAAVRRVARGEVISTNVSYVSPDGSIWGYAYSETGAGGWFKMENVTLVYDSIAFAEEHKNELTPYSGQLDGFVPNEYLYLWTYPNSGAAENICRKGDEWFNNGDVQNLGERAAYVYKDAGGSEWVYLDFLPSGWVYVPNPEADLRTGMPGLNTNNTDNTNTDDELGDTVFEDVEAGAAVSDISGETEGNTCGLPAVIAAVLAAGIMGAKKRSRS